MRSTAFGLLLANLASCAPLIAQTYPATMEVPFDEHATDCLSPEVRDEIARGQVLAEAAIAACDLGRRQDKENFQLERDDWAKQRAEAEGLRVWAAIAKTSLGVAVGVIVVEGVLMVVEALRR